MELVPRLYDREGRTGDEVVGDQEPVDAGFGHKVALRVGEPDSQFPRRQLGLLERQVHDLPADGVRNAVPERPGREG